MFKKKFLTISSLGLLMTLATLYILFRLVGESFWLTAFLMYMPQVFLTIPGIILLAISIKKKRIPESLINGVAIILVVLLFMQYKIDKPRKTPVQDAKKLAVVTYNIHAGLSGAPRVIKALRESGADVIFLQEARKSSRGSHPDPVPEIEKAFEGWKMEKGGERNELMIISRYDLSNRREEPLGSYRKCLVCDMNFHGTSVKLINVHFNTAATGKSLIRSGIRFPEYLNGTAAVRKGQVDALEKIIAGSTDHCIVAGDFNSPPNSYVKSKMTCQLEDCFDAAGSGFGFTYSSAKPFWRIDYIFVSRDFTVGECTPLNVRASDHRPVKAVLSLPRSVRENY